MHINEFAKDVHKVAKEKGWWEPDITFEARLLNLHTEISELADAWAKGKIGKAQEEGGDIGLRLLDLFEGMGWDLEKTMILKHNYNKTRTYRHGGKKF